MKRIFTLSLLLSSSLAWSISFVKVKNFNFNYANGLGIGQAASFDVVKNQSQIKVTKVGTDLEFSSPLLDDNIVWKDAPAMILDSKVDVKGFNLDLDKKVITSLTSALFTSDSRMSLQGLTADCLRKAASDVFEEVIAGCLSEGNLKVASFDSQSLNEFVSLIADEIDLKNVTVKSLNLNVKNKAFTMSLSTKIGVNGTIRARGTTDVDYQNKKAVIKVDEVKFGILNITSKFFAEIEKMKSESVEVRRPYIYLTYKNNN